MRIPTLTMCIRIDRCVYTNSPMCIHTVYTHWSSMRIPTLTMCIRIDRCVYTHSPLCIQKLTNLYTHCVYTLVINAYTHPHSVYTHRSMCINQLTNVYTQTHQCVYTLTQCVRKTERLTAAHTSLSRMLASSEMCKRPSMAKPRALRHSSRPCALGYFNFIVSIALRYFAFADVHLHPLVGWRIMLTVRTIRSVRTVRTDRTVRMVWE